MSKGMKSVMKMSVTEMENEIKRLDKSIGRRFRAIEAMTKDSRKFIAEFFRDHPEARWYDPETCRLYIQ
jgi:hypothetical protein